MIYPNSNNNWENLDFNDSIIICSFIQINSHFTMPGIKDINLGGSYDFFQVINSDEHKYNLFIYLFILLTGISFLCLMAYSLI